MHPDILKFWECTGHEVYSVDSSTDQRIFWYIYSNNIVRCIAEIYPDQNKNVYWFYSSKRYSEEEFLRLIKLKVFL